MWGRARLDTYISLPGDAMTKKVLVTDYAWPSLEPERAVLARVGAELVVAPDGDEDTLTELARDVDGILTCWAQTTERVIRAAEKCVVVSRYGVGVDNIAVDTATELGIVVAYVPDYCVQEVANHAMALLLAWNRRIVEHVTMTKQTGWSSVKLGAPMPRLGGKKLGIIGFGRMGQALGKRAQAFDMEVLAYGPRLKAEDAAAKGARGVGLSELLRESDFVSLNCPLRPDTENIIGADELAQMKETAFLANTSRGPLIDEDALYEALTSGKIAGAGLDLLVDLSPPLDHKLIQLGNVIVTPHTAFFSQEAVLELEERAAGEVASVLEGQVPENVVNPAVLGRTRAALS